MTLREILPRILHSNVNSSGRRLLKDTPYTPKTTSKTLLAQTRPEITLKTLPVYDIRLEPGLNVTGSAVVLLW